MYVFIPHNMYTFFSPEAIIPDDHDEVDLNEFDPKVK